MFQIRKKFRCEMAHVLEESYSKECPTCPVCGKGPLTNILLHFTGETDSKHMDFLKKLELEINEVIDEMAENYLSTEINKELQKHLPFLTPVSIANRTRSRLKELNIDSRRVSYMRRRGKGNPVFLPGVQEKIRQSVKNLWGNGTYKDRINGMLGKCGKDNPQFKPEMHTINYIGEFHWAKFLSGFQNITICARCGKTKKKINVHHVDEDHKNFLPSNLEPLCVPCHMAFHYKHQKQPFFTIGKTFSFPAAHLLPEHKGLCAGLHGHQWKFQIRIRKRLDPKTGMVMDFSDLKKIVEKHIISIFDHSFLNDHLYNPTAENLLLWIWETLMFDGLLKGIEQIDIWESPDSIASLDKSGMLSIFEKMDLWKEIKNK